MKMSDIANIVKNTLNKDPNFVQLNTEANKYMADNYNELVDANRKIDLSDFKKFFMPLFNNELTDKNDIELGSNAWRTVVGGHNRGVDIMQNGEVVATVPPLIATRQIALRGNGGINKMVQRKQLLERNVPGPAKRQLDANLVKHGNGMVINEDNSDWAVFRTWLDKHKTKADGSKSEDTKEDGDWDQGSMFL